MVPINSDIIISAIENSNDGVVITDPNQPDNPIIYSNKVTFEMTGYTQEEMIGINCRFLQGENPDESPKKILREKITANEPVRITLKNYRKDGTMFWNELSITPIKNSQGETTHFIGIQKDVTEAIEAKNELEKKNQEISKMNKLMVDRELKMIELKKEIESLRNQ